MVLNLSPLVEAELVKPAAILSFQVMEPALGGLVGEFLELPGRAAHVGRAAEDNGVGTVQGVPCALGQVALLVDLDQGRGGARRRGGTLMHRFGLFLGMSVAAEVDDRDFCHLECSVALDWLSGGDGPRNNVCKTGTF